MKTIDEEIKGRFRNEYHKGIINMTYTLNQLKYQFLQHLKKHGLTEPQYNVLRVLRGFRNEGAVSIGFLKERMLDKNSDISRIIDKLTDKELVSRKKHEADRRQKDIEITEKGIELIADMSDCEIKADTLLDNLTPEEIEQFNFLLDKVRINKI